MPFFFCFLNKSPPEIKINISIDKVIKIGGTSYCSYFKHIVLLAPSVLRRTYFPFEETGICSQVLSSRIRHAVTLECSGFKIRRATSSWFFMSELAIEISYTLLYPDTLSGGYALLSSIYNSDWSVNSPSARARASFPLLFFSLLEIIVI